MAELDYRIPGTASEIYGWCIDELRRVHGSRELNVLDVCAGYGVNGALMKRELSLDELYGYFRKQRDITGNGLFFDRMYLKEHDRDSDLHITGLDVAENALDYAEAAGFIDESYAVNLETDPLPRALRDAIAECSLITVTGGFSFVGETTFAKILSALPDRSATKPWIVGFPLLHTNLEALIELFEKLDYVVHYGSQYRFLQRKFANERERGGEHAALARATLEVFEDDYFESRLLLAQPRGASPVPQEILAYAADRKSETQASAMRT